MQRNSTTTADFVKLLILFKSRIVSCRNRTVRYSLTTVRKRTGVFTPYGNGRRRVQPKYLDYDQEINTFRRLEAHFVSRIASGRFARTDNLALACCPCFLFPDVAKCSGANLVGNKLQREAVVGITQTLGGRRATDSSHRFCLEGPGNRARHSEPGGSNHRRGEDGLRRRTAATRSDGGRHPTCWKPVSGNVIRKARSMPIDRSFWNRIGQH